MRIEENLFVLRSVLVLVVHVLWMRQTEKYFYQRRGGCCCDMVILYKHRRSQLLASMKVCGGIYCIPTRK